MALKRNADLGKLEREAKGQADKLHEKILASFVRAGENFLIQARSQVQAHSLGTYQDQTTNLRNSIGYYVFHNGEKVQGRSGESLDDVSAVLEAITPDGYQLVVIAGMNYASYVESKGYNVISRQAETMILNLTNFLQILGVSDKDHNQILEESFAAAGNNDYDAGL